MLLAFSTMTYDIEGSVTYRTRGRARHRHHHHHHHIHAGHAIVITIVIRIIITCMPGRSQNNLVFSRRCLYRAHGIVEAELGTKMQPILTIKGRVI